jgi:hypothetical protein
VASRNEITIDLSDTSTVDARFLGLLLILRKQLKRQHGRLTFIGASRRIAKLFRYNELSFLLAADSGVQSTTSSRARPDIPAPYHVGGVARHAKTSRQPCIVLTGDQNQ